MITNGSVTLRPTEHRDIADYRRWLIEKPNPDDWNVSWDGDDDDEAYIQGLQKSIGEKCDVYHHLEVCNESNKHIGWVSAYFTDERTKLFVGIDLPDAERRKGYGESTMLLYIAYLFDQYDVNIIYTSTLSGNKPMIRLAEKIGFEIDCVTPSVIALRGQVYDGLTFRITLEAHIARKL